MVIDDGQGIDQPILERDDLAIFEDGDEFSVRRFGEGEVKRIPGDVSEEFWDALRARGWKDPLE